MVFGLTIRFWLELFFPRRLITRVGFRFHRLVANIIKVSLRIKISGYSLFRGVVSGKKIICL